MMSGANFIRITAATRDEVRSRLDGCLKVLEIFEWIINSFVLDFFLDSHWSHLPPSWKEALANISPQDLATLLDPTSVPGQKTPWPLSLLALKQTIHQLSLPRTEVADLKFVREFLDKNTCTCDHHVASEEHGSSPLPHQNGASSRLSKEEEEEKEEKKEKKKEKEEEEAGAAGPWEFYPEALSEFAGQHAALKHVFRKHVKPKKQHELARLAKLTRDVLAKANVGKVIDVGSGMGHLSRYLCYAHNIQVACVDANDDFTAAAKKFDSQLEESVTKINKRQEAATGQAAASQAAAGQLAAGQAAAGQAAALLPLAPVHVTAHLHPGMDLAQFHSILSQRFSGQEEQELRYGIVGLHTCGDLGPILFKMFTADRKAAVLQSVGCCYMKLEDQFPLSSYLATHTTAWRRNYTNSELACHAVEMYTERLRSGDEDRLRVHCYRALLEQLLVARRPGLRHTQLRSVARAHQLDFATYVRQATSKLDVSWSDDELNSAEVKRSLSMWWEVVIYYTLRLSLAPLLETVLLLDRCLYLEEQGLSAIIFPIFNPVLSPRNQVILAVKPQEETDDRTSGSSS